MRTVGYTWTTISSVACLYPHTSGRTSLARCMPELRSRIGQSAWSTPSRTKGSVWRMRPLHPFPATICTASGSPRRDTGGSCLDQHRLVLDARTGSLWLPGSRTATAKDHHRVVQEPELPRVLRPPYRRWTRLDPFLLVRGAAPGRTHGGREVRPAAFSASQHAARLCKAACQHFSWSASCFRLLSNVTIRGGSIPLRIALTGGVTLTKVREAGYG